MPQRLCFVDLETTGANPLVDAITEAAIVSVDEYGRVEEWSTLLDPGQDIPPFIQKLTGITPDMVAGAPRFEDKAAEIYERLQGQLFIAHNARFDYSFLKAAFRRCGLSLRATVLCTVKLSRELDPREPRHNLDSLIERHGLPAGERHRALGDARVVWELWRHLHAHTEAERLREAIAGLTRRPPLPGYLDPDLADELPTGCGVYICYGEADEVLHIGHSLHLRHRVLSHFSAAKPSALDLALAQRIRRLEWSTTPGETGARLLHAHLKRQLRPSLDRGTAISELCTWLWIDGGSEAPRLAFAHETEFGAAGPVHGLYRNGAEAQKALRRLAKKHRLCLKMLGLEKGREGKACQARLGGDCHGACLGLESAERHRARLGQALAELRLAAWPFAGRIGLREHNEYTRQTRIHWLDRWAYLGSGDEGDPPPAAEASFDVDVWKVIQSALKRWPEADIVRG